MRFKVPQDVQREDQILWFITLRQLIFLIVGGGISYMLFVKLSEVYYLSEIAIVFICIPAAISAAFAFLKIKGISFGKFILVFLEQTFFRPSRRFWQSSTGVFISMTNVVSLGNKKSAQVVETKALSQDKIKNLAALLDNKNSQNTSINSL